MPLARSRLLLGLALAAATVLLFARVRGFDFVGYDDDIYVVQNPHLEKGLTAEGLRWTLEPYETNWIPLTWLSLLVDHALVGKEPGGYHVTNLALHVASVLLLFGALASMTGAPGPSAFVAAVFAWHPLHVESVAWVSERKDVLSGLFWMATLAAWAAYARRPSPFRWRGALRYAAVAVLFAAGLLAKSVGVTLPAVLLLLDFWPLRRLTGPGGRFEAARVGRALVEKLPLLPIAAAIAAVTYVVQEERGAMTTLEDIPLGIRIQNALVAYVLYLRDAVWPIGLAVFHPHPKEPYPVAQWAGAALALTALTAGALAAWRRRPWLTVGWLWYLGTLVPMIGLVQVGLQARADRYTYLPLVGVAIALAFEVADRARTPAARRAAAALALAALGGLALATHRHLEHWRDGERLFRHALEVTGPDNFVAHQSLGTLALRRDDADTALRHYAEAVRIQPEWAVARAGLADALAAQGRLDEAVLNFGEAVRDKPRDVLLRLRFGQVLVKRGWMDEAIAQYQAALRLDAEDGEPLASKIHALLGAAYAAREDAVKAASHYERSLALDADQPEIRANLALARLASGADPADSAARLEAMLAAGTDAPELRLGLADALVRAGRAREALPHFRAALAARPEWTEAANNLAWLLATSPEAGVRDPAEALRWAEVAAAASERRDPSVLDTLAVAQAAAGRFGAAVATLDAALALPASAADPALATSLRSRREAFAAGRPYTE